MLCHVTEQFHTWESGETGVTVVPVRVQEKLVIGSNGSKIWIRADEFDPAIHTVFDPPKPSDEPRPQVLAKELYRPRVRQVLSEVSTTRVANKNVRPGETRMMTLLPSPTLEPGALPLSIPYDEAVLAWRHHRWPDCVMTDRP